MTNNGALPPGVRPEVAHRAIEWLVDLQSGTSDSAARQAHRAWLAQDPEHARAWAHIEAVNLRLRGAAGGAATGLIAQATLAPVRDRRRAHKALAVLVFASGATWQITERGIPQTWLADLRTGVGQRRRAILADGSALVLNTDSAVQLHFSAGERRLRLLAGELMLTTGRDSDHRATARPLVLETAQGELRPQDSRFAVRQLATSCRVDVFEGRLAVLPHGHGRAAPSLMRAGERANFGRFGLGPRQQANEADNAWTSGMLVAAGMRLDEFLAELARHRRGRLQCDPAVAGLRISGTYPLADTDAVLTLISRSLPVRVHFMTRWWVSVAPAQG